jgi:hypothetical protein
MKLPSLRGLFASAASIALLTGSLVAAFPAQATPAAPTNVTVHASIPTLKLEEAVPVAAAQNIMKAEGWTPVMSGYALKNMKETKGIFSLWKQGDSGRWRILQTFPDGQAKMTSEGTGLKLSAPKNLLARQASAPQGGEIVKPESSKAVRHINAQKCGDGLKEAEMDANGLSIIAEGVAEKGGAMMTLTANYYADDGYTPTTWAMYYDFASKPGMSCRLEAGFAINFDKGFAEQKPLDYPNPKVPMGPG